MRVQVRLQGYDTNTIVIIQMDVIYSSGMKMNVLSYIIYISAPPQRMLFTTHTDAMASKCEIL